jgi:metal-responsive CopG/Arc/MetJ family transcriptional regulator
VSPRQTPRRPIVGVRISEAGIQAIDAFALSEQVGRSEMIRRLLAEAITARQRRR